MIHRAAPLIFHKIKAGVGPDYSDFLHGLKVHEGLFI